MLMPGDLFLSYKILYIHSDVFANSLRSSTAELVPISPVFIMFRAITRKVKQLMIIGHGRGFCPKIRCRDNRC